MRLPTANHVLVPCPQSRNCNVPTNKSQPVIKSPPTLIKALMCNCKPLHLLRKHLLTTLAQHPNIELIQPLRIRVDQILGPPGVIPQTEWCLCTGRSMRPSRLLCFGRGSRLCRCRVSVGGVGGGGGWWKLCGGEDRAGAGEGAACGPGCPD